jgi:hypothetical protein
MEFTTKISEQDYIAGYRLAHKSVLMTMLSVWLYVLFAWFLYIFVMGLIFAPKNPSTAFNGLIVLFLLGYLWIYLPYRVRRCYRKDPIQQGEIAVQLRPEGVSEKSSMGSNSSYPWTVCSHWRESKRVIILMLQSGIFFIFPKTCLSTEQQSELRSILAAALPKK